MNVYDLDNTVFTTSSMVSAIKRQAANISHTWSINRFGEVVTDNDIANELRELARVADMYAKKIEELKGV